MELRYKRILLKLSGEMFGGEKKKGIDFDTVEKVAKCLINLKKKYPVDLAVVIGAGNIFRGRMASGRKFDRAQADYMGMLGTIINALALQGEIERLGGETRLLSALNVASVCEPFIRRRALRHLEKGRIVILGGGTGSPFFTTDSAAALKATELQCDAVLKGSNVDGVYDCDPKKNGNATKFETLTYQYALEKGLMVMDATAFALCQHEKIPIIVFDADNLDNVEKIITGEKIGTLITEK
ncbi:MAG: Uridylate kinase [Candidatus Shapirobacteria bacterium GW2011_GWE1_38_10]|uniref:Uridylate kinase n=1 Tax=Candidatus Shapirobacteria bacterium GW2011_GWE1_38_10 TaxID=1618488 RepID=A0A0G0IFE4_9BACT|nr:MAG: Uridylate kinase [Candidatus Shapirobacteria bacterium GW2011_GWF2_37_20]KKQ49695.1 MAG: Uridylate kinase [Candidatus Shapirobacteria bacterium GW2011_GWE1_38_10]KKQ62994.1 MAG: Uridylate kinase [Candidatus Shapirobacteria bacterium GW2011_GWF1_38_23]HBP50768.1 UMP kinase [Candidatus Shapirobacteria bacterium]